MFSGFSSGTLASEAANPAVGLWHLKQPTVGESKLYIAEEAGKLEAQEIGLANARVTAATFKDGLLVVHWKVSDDLQGYWELGAEQ